jgi:hypothetical protein
MGERRPGRPSVSEPVLHLTVSLSGPDGDQQAVIDVSERDLTLGMDVFIEKLVTPSIAAIFHRYRLHARSNPRLRFADE